MLSLAVINHSSPDHVVQEGTGHCLSHWRATQVNPGDPVLSYRGRAIATSSVSLCSSCFPNFF
jgi:hypothetical protein